MAGVAGAIGIFFTWRGQQLTQQAQEDNQQTTQRQLRNAQKQLRLTQISQDVSHKYAQEELRLTREGQITERFTRAIDQLGHDRTAIRLGGIYALERIARESEYDCWPIMETLTAYVRQHAPSRPERVDQEREEEEAVEKKAEEDLREETQPTEVPISGPDIQGIITMVCLCLISRKAIDRRVRSGRSRGRTRSS
jgi:hypothetical protein